MVRLATKYEGDLFPSLEEVFCFPLTLSWEENGVGMPIYCYQCESCDTTFKILSKNDGSGPPIVCPKCSGRQVKRLLPHVGIIYRGTGYYRTDSRSRSKAEVSSDTERSTD
jgi:putative FmdB family regulatory protein